MTSPTIYWGNPYKQDACWYVNDNPTEVVWEQPELSDYCVCRVGEMRIHYTSPTGNTILRYTDDIEKVAGYKLDHEVNLASGRGEFDWIDTAWFEILSDANPNYQSDLFDTLDDAIRWAVGLGKIGVLNSRSEEPNVIY